MNIMNMTPLSEKWMPPELLIRTEELRTIIAETIKDPFPPSHLWIQGDRGIGKTLTIKFFMNEIETRLLGKSFYIQCESSFEETFEKFSLQHNLGIPKKELSMYEILVALKKQGKIDESNLFFIIDDLDKIRMKKLIDGMIFSLYENTKDYSRSIILVSRLDFFKIDKYLEEDTQSRLQLKPILFKRYDASQLKRILMQRLSFVLEPTEYTEGALAYLAALMVRIGADMRKTLEILRTAIQVADAKLDEPQIELAWKREKRRFWAQSLKDLPPHQALLLTALAEQKTTLVVPLETLATTYDQKCKDLDIEPLSRRMLYYLINGLYRKGYIHKVWAGLRITENPDNILEASKELDWKQIL